MCRICVGDVLVVSDTGRRFVEGVSGMLVGHVPEMCRRCVGDLSKMCRRIVGDVQEILRVV